MTTIGRRITNAGKSSLFQIHKIFLKFGLIVLPNHYYTPIADLRNLAKFRSQWARRSPMHGVDTEVSRQIAWLRTHVMPLEAEYRGNAPFHEGVAAGYGPGYGYIEAQCLHGVVRSLKPRRIIEVGSGVSTYIMLGALTRNAADGTPGKITCIEPYPSNFLKVNGEIRLLPQPVEALDPAAFDVLEAGDMLFIDSTHAVRPGGDVVHLYLNVIPRLKPGVLVHIHDIYFPYLYQRDLLTSLFQWEETALLAALLTNNQRLSIVTCLSQLHYDDAEGLAEVFPEYRREPDTDGLSDAPGTGHFPASIYLITC